MKIDSLILNNFRNIESLELKADPRLNLLIGDNGQGKTNIVEALVYLSFGQSFRIKDDLKLIRYGEQFTKIDSKGVDKESLSVVISKAGKYITRNEVVLKRLSELIGHLNVVLFQPDDINFFTNAPRLRRRDIDYELGKADQSTLSLLKQHRDFLSLRNQALKRDVVDHDSIDVLDNEIIIISSILIKKRTQFIDYLENKVESYFQMITGSDENIEISYQTVVPMSDSLEQDLRKKIKDSYQRDLAFKVSHVGIHKDDYIFKMNGMDVSDTASQGQRRVLILSYKLALVDYFIEMKQVYPILCLDDLYSELDAQKRHDLLNWIPDDIQIFITSTDLSFINPKAKGKIFEIKQGKIIKEALR